MSEPSEPIDMTDMRLEARPDPASDPALQAPEPTGVEKAIELEGTRALDDQASYVDQADVEQRPGLTDTELYEGELEARGGAIDADGSGSERLEVLTELELRGDETDNPDVAAEEGLPYVPPMDPPIVPSDDAGGIAVAAGFGASALDEPYDEDHQNSLGTGEDDLAARVREALRADSATSGYADRIVIGSRGGTVVLRGMVADLDDTDALVEVAQRATGVVEVIDEVEVEGMDQPLGGG